MQNIFQLGEGSCHRTSNDHLSVDFNQYNKSYFTDFPSLIKNKSYIAISGCVLDHIITNQELSNNEKLYYIVADSLAMINANSGNQRSIALPSHKWSDRLDCTRSQIFSMQKSLEQKGFFIIHKDKNNIGQNKRNIIIPTLPKGIFDNLCQNSENRVGGRVGESVEYDPDTEYMRSYLDRTKLFIKINYDLLSGIIAHNCLSSFQKIIWLDFYIKSYKRHVFSRYDNYNTDIINDFKNNLDFSFINSQLELSNRYSCTKKHISKSINILKDLGFIKIEHFYTKHKTQNQNNDRQDKSLYKVIVSLPLDFWFRLENVKNRSNIQINNLNEEDSEINRGGSSYIINDNNIDLTENNFIPQNQTIKFDIINRETIKNKINYVDLSLCKESYKSKYIENVKELRDGGVFSDPHFSKIRPLLNKDLKLNIKILDLDLIKKSKILKIKNKENLFEKKAAKFDKNKDFKKLTEYLPLANSDLVLLKEQSGYSIDFIEKLSNNIATKYPERSFYSKKGVIKYLSIVLNYEKRNRYAVSQGKFRFCESDEHKTKFRSTSLDDFMPFDEDILKEISRRIDFKYSDHFINKLAKHINHKYPDIKFRSEKSLINYMVKALDNEMRNPKDVNRDNFIFRWELKEIEKYEFLAQKDKIKQNGILEKFRMNNHIQYQDQDQYQNQNQEKIGINTEGLRYVNTYKHIYGSDNKIIPNFYNLSESDSYYLENQKQEGALPIWNIIEKFLK